MVIATASLKFQIVIPKKVRETTGIFAGQKLQMLSYQNRIQLIPLCPMSQMKGFLKGIDTNIERSEDRS